MRRIWLQLSICFGPAAAAFAKDPSRLAEPREPAASLKVYQGHTAGQPERIKVKVLFGLVSVSSIGFFWPLLVSYVCGVNLCQVRSSFITRPGRLIIIIIKIREGNFYILLPPLLVRALTVCASPPAKRAQPAPKRLHPALLFPLPLPPPPARALALRRPAQQDRPGRRALAASSAARTIGRSRDCRRHATAASARELANKELA